MNDAKVEPVKRINNDLIELNELSISFDNQLSRLRSAIRRIDDIDELEKAELREGLSKEEPFDQLTLQHKVRKLCVAYNEQLKKFAYLLQKLDERI